MVQLEKELKNILAHNSLSYIPPVVLHMENVSGWQPPVNNTSETKAKKGEGKAKGLWNWIGFVNICYDLAKLTFEIDVEFLNQLTSYSRQKGNKEKSCARYHQQNYAGFPIE